MEVVLDSRDFVDTKLFNIKNFVFVWISFAFFSIFHLVLLDSLSETEQHVKFSVSFLSMFKTTFSFWTKKTASQLREAEQKHEQTSCDESWNENFVIVTF